MPGQEHLIADVLRSKTFGKAKASFLCHLCLFAFKFFFFFPKEQQQNLYTIPGLALWLSASCNLLETTVQTHSLHTACQDGPNMLQQCDAMYQVTINSPIQIRYFFFNIGR